MYNPIGRGFVQGGVFKTISSTVNEQDEWTAVMTVQYSATVSPILGYKTSLDEYFPMGILKTLHEHFHAAVVKDWNDNGHNN